MNAYRITGFVLGTILAIAINLLIIGTIINMVASHFPVYGP